MIRRWIKTAAVTPERPRLFDRLVFIEEPQSPTAEAIRALRTRIMAQHLAHGDKALALCAPTADVGCSFVAANLAIACAQIGVNTVLIDTDIRSPALARMFRIAEESRGLSDLLADSSAKPDAALLPCGTAGLSLLSSGCVTHNPQELLASRRFRDVVEQLTARFDLVLFDTTPTNCCTDAQRVATVAGHALIVARKHGSYVNDVMTLSRLLRADAVKLVGATLTGAL